MKKHTKGSGLEFGIRGDDGSVAEELLQNIPEIEQKCRVVDNAIYMDIMSKKQALKEYGVTEQQYVDFKNNAVQKQYEQLVHLHGEKAVAENFIFPTYYTDADKKKVIKKTSETISKMKEGRSVEDKILSFAMQLRFQIEGYDKTSSSKEKLYKELAVEINLINKIIQ